MDAWLAAAVARWLDRARVPILTGVVALLVWMAAGAAIAKPFWHDEIYTLLLAKLPSLSAIWAAHREGVDLQPPLTTFATRVIQRTLGSGAVVSRLPALAGFCLMTLAVAVMLRRRTGMTLALAGALMPVQTAAYRYAYEARGYGLMLGFFALALFAWAEAAQGRGRRLWIPVCAVALAAGVWAHYYAAYAFLTLAAGEAVRAARERRVDRAMVGGLLAGAVLTLPLAPLIAAALEQSPRFWARASDLEVAAVYRFLLEPLWSLLVSPRGGLVLLALAFTAVTIHIGRSRGWIAPSSARGPHEAVAWPLHETVALLVTGLAPLVMVLAARMTPGAFTPRYGLAVVVAVAIGLPLLVRRLAPRGSLAEVVLLIIVATPMVQSAVSGARQPPAYPDPLADRPLLRAALERPGPVVASGSLTYLQLWYYAPPAARTRLIYLADPDAALRITGADTFDRGYLALAGRTALSVQPFEEFISRRREFTMYAAGSGWLLPYLEQQGASLELVGAEPGGREFRVSWKVP